MTDLAAAFDRCDLPPDAVDGVLKPFFGTSVWGVALQKSIMDELRP